MSNPPSIFRTSTDPVTGFIHKVPADTKTQIRDQFLGPIETQVQRLLDNFWAFPRTLTAGFPKIDVYEHEGKFVVEYSLAGVTSSDVKVEIDEQPDSEFREYGTRLLKVSGGMPEHFKHKQGANYHVKELSRKHFVRTLILPEYVKTDPVATYRDGMLTLTFDLPPKEEPAKPQIKSIPIVSHGGPTA